MTTAKKFDNINSGALFKNEKTKDGQPDYRGSVNVGGDEFWISCWVKTSKAGTKYMSLALKPKSTDASDDDDI